MMAWMRWLWRQLTSMRTALLLLFALALASIPGSVLPQRGTNPIEVNAYLADHPGIGPLMDRFGLFDVFASPWFAAIYLLLMLSLAGCIVPRIAQHWRAVRQPPPPAPRNLARMPAYAQFTTGADGQAVLDAAEKDLSRWRVRRTEQSLSAERGFSAETGNLIFHCALLALLISVGYGSLYGWRGNVIVSEGSGFANTVTQYDTFTPGRFVDSADLPPFSLTVDGFSARYETEGAQRGAPRDYQAEVTYRTAPGEPEQTATMAVNKPLEIDGSKVFLLGHGYAPKLKITTTDGQVIYDEAPVFLPQDGNFTSTGVAKVPDAPVPMALQGIFLPTAALDSVHGPHSVFPALADPAVFLSAWQGDLGLDSGVPQSVFSLDTAEMERIGIEALRPGESWTLPNDAGTVEFLGVQNWVSLQISHDPGKIPALISAVVALAGLMMSLIIPRRRIWVKVASDNPDADAGADGDRTRVELGALARTESADVTSDLERLIGLLGASSSQRELITTGKASTR